MEHSAYGVQLYTVRQKKMDDERENAIPSDEELRKRLFSSPSPDKASGTEEEDEEGIIKESGHEKAAKSERKRRRRAGVRLGSLAVMLFLVLCASTLLFMLHFNDHWRQITWIEVQEGAAQFFSNEPLNGEDHKSQALFGILGALPLAVSIGVWTGAFTCLFMYYDSDVPGDFPPTPVSPRKTTDPSHSDSRWHLGYIFVPVNALVAFSLALFFLRLHIGLGIV